MKLRTTSPVATMVGTLNVSAIALRAYRCPLEYDRRILCTSTTRDQSRIIKSYARAALKSELLNREVTDDQKDLFRLRNGITLRILTGTFRHVRSYSQIAVVVDEICFFQGNGEDQQTSDELIRAIRPSLLTTRGRLICVSTKWRPRGFAYNCWKRHFGKDGRV